MEIGDNLEVEELESDEGSTRSPTAAGSRRKNGRNTGKGRNGKRNGNSGGGDAPRDVAAARNGGSVREADLRRLLAAMRDLKEGDFNVRLPVSDDPLLAEIADEFNAVAKLSTRMCDEMTRVSKTIGRQGQMNDRVSIGAVTGGWRQTTDSVNTLITDLASPTAI